MKHNPVVIDVGGAMRACGLFAGLDASQLEGMAQRSNSQRLRSGELLFREGDTADAMYVVTAGAVQVFTHDAMGREIVLVRLEAGAHLGEQSLLPGASGRRSASVRAVADTWLARIPRAELESVLRVDAALARRLEALGAQQLRSDFQHLSVVASRLDLTPSSFSRRTFADGEVVFREGDEADALYLVRAGTVAILQQRPDGTRARISTVVRGGCVGELALLKRQPRSATAVAEGPVEAAVIARDRFDDMLGRSQALREHLQTLERVYELPRRGTLALHSGRVAGEDCVTALYMLDDGRRFAARRVVGHDLYTLERLPGDGDGDGSAVAGRLSWADTAMPRRRELVVADDGTLIGLTAQGAFQDADRLHAFVLDGRRLSAVEREAFLARGSFPALDDDAPDGAHETEPDAVICRCLHVTAGALGAAIAAGACSFDALQRATGCGSLCGGCTPSVVELLGIDHWVPAVVVEERDEAPGIRSFVLAPRDPGYPQPQVGQHVVVEGALRGVRVRRPYTVSSARRARERLHITVKREDGGVFSPWLFEAREQRAALRITRPQGRFVLDLDGADRAPVALLVAGIGVTPALAAVRSVLDEGLPTRVLVHYSGRERAQMACADELCAAMRQAPNVEVVLRETAREGRLDAAAVAAIVGRVPDARWFLCGPARFLEDGARWLGAAGVAPGLVHREVFTASGAPPARAALAASALRAFDASPPARPPAPAPLKAAARRAAAAALRALNSPRLDGSVLGLQLNPVRALTRWLVMGPAGLDPAVPYNQLALFGTLFEGSFLWQLCVFRAHDARGLARRERALKTIGTVNALPPHTGDGNTVAASIVALDDIRLPPPFDIATGWRRLSERRFAALYLVRGRAAFAHVMAGTEPVDRGPMPYHYAQQVCGSRHAPAGCPAAGLIVATMRDNPVWSEDRALAVDSFHFGQLDDMAATMSAAIDEALAAVDEAIASDPERVVDVDTLMLEVSFTVLLRVLLGPVELAEFLALGEDMTRAVWALPDALIALVMEGKPFGQDVVELMEHPRRQLQTFVERVRQLDAEGQFGQAQRAHPFVRRLLAGADQPDGGFDRLVPLLLPLLIAGHETTGHTLAFALHELARQPALEARMLEESQGFAAARGRAPLVTGDYDERPLMHAFLAENLRLHSPIGWLARTADRAGHVPPDADTGIGGFAYPAGATFLCSVIGAHHDPKRWPDPTALRVERYLGDVDPALALLEQGRAVRRAVRAREEAFDLLPFGAGPGRCAGQPFAHHESIMVLDALLTRYRFEFVDPAREVALSQVVVLAPEKGELMARVRRRHAGAPAPG